MINLWRSRFPTSLFEDQSVIIRELSAARAEQTYSTTRLRYCITRLRYSTTRASAGSSFADALESLQIFYYSRYSTTRYSTTRASAGSFPCRCPNLSADILLLQIFYYYSICRELPMLFPRFSFNTSTHLYMSASC